MNCATLKQLRAILKQQKFRVIIISKLLCLSSTTSRISLIKFIFLYRLERPNFWNYWKNLQYLNSHGIPKDPRKRIFVARYLNCQLENWRKSNDKGTKLCGLTIFLKKIPETETFWIYFLLSQVPLQAKSKNGFKVSAPLGSSFCCYDAGTFEPHESG